MYGFIPNLAGRFYFGISNGTDEKIVTANNFGLPTAGTWIFVRGWHNAADDTVNIQVNNGTPNSLATAGVAPQDSNGTFRIGNAFAGSSYFPGRIDNAYLRKQISSTDEATSLFNSGKGRQYAELAGTSLANNVTIISGDTLNGNFETAGTGGQPFGSWTSGVGGASTVNNETSIVHSGSHAVRIDVDSSNTGAGVNQQILTAGKRYKATFWAKINDATGNSSMKVMNNAGSRIYLSQALTTTWTQYTVYFTPIDTSFWLGRDSAANKSIYIDDVTLEEVPLISFWEFDNKANLGIDSVTSSANDLTNNGTVTQTYGVNYNEGSVAKWLDQSGNAVNFTQPTLTKRPAYDSIGINNYPALRFDGVDDALVKTGDQIGTGDVTMFAVIKPAAFNVAFSRIIDNGSKYSVSLMPDGKIQVSSDNITGAPSAVGSINLNSGYVVSVTRAASGIVNIYINGTRSGTADQSSGTPVVGGDTYIGNRSQGDRTFDGWLGPVIIQPAIMGNVERNQIERTLGAKYGITVTSQTTPPASSSVYPSIATKAPLAYSSLTSFTPNVAGDSTGTLRYQLSNDSNTNNTSSTWYWWDGAAWSAADKNNAYQSNTAVEVNAHLSAFTSTVSPSWNFKWKSFFVTDGIDNPHLTSLDLDYISDTVAPDQPVLIKAFSEAGGTKELTSGNWYNYPHPSFSWTAPEDHAGDHQIVSGIGGYYVYFGEDAGSTPKTSGSFQTGTTHTVPAETTLTSGHTYYLRVQAEDNAGNAADTKDLFTYKYDTEVPTSLDHINVSPVGCSTAKEFTFTFPDSSDTNSGIAKYQYKLGSTGVDDPENNKTETTTLSGIKPYQDGDNIIYLRSWDKAGNASAWQSAVFCATGVVSVVDGPTVEAGPSSMTIKWTSSKPTTSYVRVYQGNDYVSEQGQVAYAQNHEVKIVGLTSEAIYRYKLVWSDQSGNVGESDWYETKTAATPQVTNLKADVISPSKVNISWSTNYSANSKLEYGVGTFDKSINLEGSGTSFARQVEGLTAGSNYQLRIKAKTTDNSEFSGGVTFQTPPLPSISNLKFDYLPSASTSVRATWTTNVDTTSIISYRRSPSTGATGEGRGEGNDSDWKQASDATMTKDHVLEIKDLADNTDYDIVAKSMDTYGNYATSDTQHYSTPFDTRPPKVKNLTIEVKATGFGTTQKAQLVATWETDEPATSQLEYALGISGTEYANTTKEDQTLSTSHVVIASELDPSKIYHLRAVSKDRAGNKGTSEDTTVITGKVQQSVIDIIMNSLERSLGWIFTVFK